MPLPDTGKISHKDIMTEFEHPRADFKLSGDGAPILQRATNAQVKESDFYGMKKGGDLGGANFGQVIAENASSTGMVTTENGFTWKAVHSSVGPQYSSGGERVVRSYIQGGSSAKNLRLNASMFTEDLEYITPNTGQSAPRNFGSSGGGSHGKYEGYWPKYNGNYQGQTMYVTNVDQIDNSADNKNSGAVSVGLNFNSCCVSRHGTCNPSPCMSNGDAGGVKHAPNARFYVGFGSQQQSALMYKTSTNGTSFSYPKGGTAYLSSSPQQWASTGLLNGVVGLGSTGAWYKWTSTAAPESGSGGPQQVGAMVKFKGKYYYGFAFQNSRHGGKRMIRSGRFPPGGQTEVVNGLDFAGPAYGGAVAMFISPDESAIIYGSVDANGKGVFYSSKDGNNWSKTHTTGALYQSRLIVSNQMWCPENI